VKIGEAGTIQSCRPFQWRLIRARVMSELKTADHQSKVQACANKCGGDRLQ
jgi:hypothetical protein